jgi:hypothetical protein
MQAYDFNVALITTMQAFSMPLKNPSLYKQKYLAINHTSTLLIHILKYLASISLCFTKGNFKGRV